MEEKDFPFPILYEDNHLLIVEKPAGIPTQRPTSGMRSINVEDELKSALQLRDKKATVFLYTIFRLDKPVSGIVLFAKSSKALSRLQKSQRDHLYRKEYRALVTTPIQKGIVTDFLLKEEFKTKIVPHNTKEAKKAELEILSCTSIKNTIFELSISLITGRYHQIRAQLSSRGAPIIGDSRYGAPIDTSFPFFSEERIALHHRALLFPHPIQLQEKDPRYISVVSEPSWLQ